MYLNILQNVQTLGPGQLGRQDDREVVVSARVHVEADSALTRRFGSVEKTVQEQDEHQSWTCHLENMKNSWSKSVLKFQVSHIFIFFV